MLKVYEDEISKAREALESGNVEGCFGHLERAHVLSQRMTGWHTHVHWLMLLAGWRQRDWRTNKARPSLDVQQGFWRLLRAGSADR